ncbi:MAG: class I tRNA ligase family protein [Cytophagales bacterium]|nr:class I tRNA ligase family protein [Cytophagales bacterium]
MNFREIDQKWQRRWDSEKTYASEFPSKKPKYYILDMFPYPSGAGLHVGHPLGYIASDILARYYRMRGFNVLHPMGFDSFGLAAEQYAIQTGQHPMETTQKNRDRYIGQLKRIGLSYDWSREIDTSQSDYYKWTQWIFKELFHTWFNKESDRAESIEDLKKILDKQGNIGLNASCDEDTPRIDKGTWGSYTEIEKGNFLLKYRLAYLSDVYVNWCPDLGTVLSNDEVKEGYSVRGNYPVLQKKMRQWMLRIRAYADRLLKNLDTLDWPESVKDMQRNWMGRSLGAEIKFFHPHTPLRVFTTRPDTLYGVSFLALAPESEYVAGLIHPDHADEVNEYLKRPRQSAEKLRSNSSEGVFTGNYAQHPLSGKPIPIWIADYVLVEYGTGAVMGVPAHDARDYIFAKAHGLPIKPVILDNDIEDAGDFNEPHEAKTGRLIDSGIFSDLSPSEAIPRIISHLEDQGLGKPRVQYRLRDAVFSRQRYWGEPIPIYYRDGTPYSLSDHDLPLRIPSIKDYRPTSEGSPPLSRLKNWKNSSGYPYETNTMPGWAGSSWYFFRYMDPHNESVFCSPEAQRYWHQVDIYVGGREHAVGHLLYARFWTHFLYDRGYVNTEEFAKKLVNQGMILGESRFIHLLKGKKTYVSLGQLHNYSPEEVVALHVNTDWVDAQKTLDLSLFLEKTPNLEGYKFILEDGGLRSVTDTKGFRDIFREGDIFICAEGIEKMSKSRYNVVNPDHVIDKYGADTLRLYEMFLGPIEQTKPWNTQGIEGVHRFLRKVWTLFYPKDKFLVEDIEPSDAEKRIIHRLVKKLRDDMERLSFNTCISALMVAVNRLSELDCRSRSILCTFLKVLSPFSPHIAEELWENCGHKGSISKEKFPNWEEKYLEEDSYLYPITVNGKLRAQLSFPVDTEKEEIISAVLAREDIKKFIGPGPPKRIVFVPGRIVNIVV